MGEKEQFSITTRIDGDRYFFGILILTTALAVYFLLFKFPATPIFSESDQLIFIHEATRLLNGEVMYRDFFEFTFPGTQVLYQILLSIFGQTYSILPVTIIVLGVCLSSTCFLISREVITGPFKYLPPLFFVFFGFRWFGLDGSHRLFSVLFVLIAVLLLLKGRGIAAYALAGSVCALASFFTQQRGIVMVGAITLFAVIEGMALRSPLRETFRNIAILWGIFLAVITGLTFYFVYAAGAGNFFFATLEFPIRFYGYSTANNSNVYFDDLAKAAQGAQSLSGMMFFLASLFYAVLLPASIAAIVVALIAKRRNLHWSDVRNPILLLVVWICFTATTAGHSPGRLFQMTIPSLVLLGWSLSKIGRVVRFEKSLTAAIACVLFSFGFFQAVRMQTHWDFRTLDIAAGQVAFISSEQAQFYEHLSKLTQSGDYVYQPTQPFVYFPLGLRNPTRMSQVWPSDYTRPEQVGSVVQDLEVHRPHYIVWTNTYSKPDTARDPGDHTGLLARFVESNYFPIGEIYELDGVPMQIWQSKNAKSEND